MVQATRPRTPNRVADGAERAVKRAVRTIDETAGLREVASTRVLIAAGKLITEGLSPREAARVAVVGPLTDDSVVTAGLVEMIDAYLSDQLS